MGFLSGLFSKGKNPYSDIKIPDYWSDIYYKKAQEPLTNIGVSLLSGKPPEYFAPIGEAGGTELDRVLGLLTRDVTKAVNEDLVRRGVSRGGVGAEAISKAVGDIGTNLRWADYMRMLQGRQNLLTAGANILGGVRSGALSEENIRNPFALNRTKLELGKAEAEDKWNQQQGSKLTKLIKTGIGVALPMVAPGIKSILGASMLASNVGSTAGSVLNPTIARFNPGGYTGLPAGF